MFFDILSALCKQNGISTYKAATDIGLNRAAVAKWKKGAIPGGTTLSKLSDYFGVTTDYLLGSETEKAPTLTEKDRRDIAREVDRIMEDLSKSGDLMFDGVPMSDEARASMAAAMRVGLEEARRRNKETYTPKKYKNKKG